MAKKHNRQSKLKIYLDKSVNYLYQHGFLHSLVYHTAILLFLALCYPIIAPNQRLSPISLSFQTQADLTEPDTECFPEIENNVEISPISDNSDASSLCPADHLVSEAENDSDTLIQSIEIMDLQIPSKNESLDDASLVQQIRGIDTPTDQETADQVLSTKSETKSDQRKKQSQVLGLPSTFLQNGDQLNTQLTTNVSNTTNQGEIGKRLKEAGAQTGDVQVSLAWDTIDDLDLHVVVNPLNSHINWRHRFGNCGGVLDVDMNFHPGMLTNKPVENIFWAHGAAPRAEYVVGVHYYMSWSRIREVKATVLVKVDGKTQSFPVVVVFGQPLTPVTRFVR